MSDGLQDLLCNLPSVDRLLALLGPGLAGAPRALLIRGAREAVEAARRRTLETRDPRHTEETAVLEEAKRRVREALRPNLRRVVNGTGVVVHTNLGRSPLAPSVLAFIEETASGYSNLEFDLKKGGRGIRYSVVEPLVKELTGAEAALVVNNNAGAVFLCLKALAEGREVVVSRGELVEIGGAFRVPDVMAQSGALLREIGTTNRTHPRDYEAAIGENTAMLLKVHTSNFAVVGFTSSVSMAEVAGIAKRRGILAMEDLGSGNLVDFSAYGFAPEPTVQDAVASGADVVCFSGDKMLGGPQAGIIVGKNEVLDRVKHHPLNRALRIDKLTLAALEATLRLYRDPRAALEAVPVLAMLTAPETRIRRRAQKLAARLHSLGIPGLEVRVVRVTSRVGGGALPRQDLPSAACSLTLSGKSAARLEEALRGGDPPVIGRIENGGLLLDARTLTEKDIPLALRAVRAACQHLAASGTGPLAV